MEYFTHIFLQRGRKKRNATALQVGYQQERKTCFTLVAESYSMELKREGRSEELGRRRTEVEFQIKSGQKILVI